MCRILDVITIGNTSIDHWTDFRIETCFDFIATSHSRRSPTCFICFWNFGNQWFGRQTIAGVLHLYTQAVGHLARTNCIYRKRRHNNAWKSFLQWSCEYYFVHKPPAASEQTIWSNRVGFKWNFFADRTKFGHSTRPLTFVTHRATHRPYVGNPCSERVRAKYLAQNSKLNLLPRHDPQAVGQFAQVGQICAICHKIS